MIRTPTDFGTIVLIGRRFLHKDYFAFLALDWSPSKSDDISSDLSSFWGTITSEQGEDVDTKGTFGDSQAST